MQYISVSVLNAIFDPLTTQDLQEPSKMPHQSEKSLFH